MLSPDEYLKLARRERNTKLERRFMELWTELDTGRTPALEYVFAPPRRWRFDFAFVQERLAIELEGGTWVNGAHGRGKHFQSDVDKYNTAVSRGWRVLRFTTNDVRQRSAEMLELVCRCLNEGV